MFEIIRRKRILYHAFRILYPVGIHFGIQQIVILASFFLEPVLFDDRNSFLTDPLFMTAAAAVITFVPAVLLYRSDRKKRISEGRILLPFHQPDPPESADIPDPSLNPAEVILLLIGGAALSMCGNVLLGIVEQIFAPEGFSDVTGQLMMGKNSFLLILMVGILAPAAEEMIFRWLVFLRIRDLGIRCAASAFLSGILFGIYHGNMGQAVYAAVLGFFFAWFLEKSGNLWSCVLLHMGANIWSVLMLHFGETLPDTAGYVRFFMISFFLSIPVLIITSIWALRKSRKNGFRMV